jgi:hypothetical protein
MAQQQLYNDDEVPDRDDREARLLSALHALRRDHYLSKAQACWCSDPP